VQNVCSAGVLNPAGIAGIGPWTWTCDGTGNGAPANCLANPIPAAVCGAANGTAASSIPTKNFCTVGTPSSVTGNGPWAWTCSVGSSGIAANCSTDALNSQYECLLNWAEQHYARYFAPAGEASLAMAPYTFRYYQGTGNYVGLSSVDSKAYVLGPSFGIDPVAIGPVSNFLGQSGCQ
jgi:hypothetical protein